MSPIETKRYLGDGVYSEFDGHQIKLTTSTGHDSYDSNVIFLDPVVVNNLLDYVKWVTSYRSLGKSTAIEPEFKGEEYKIEYPVVTSDYIKDAIERNFGGGK
jgi:hypothetical protein